MQTLRSLLALLAAMTLGSSIHAQTGMVASGANGSGTGGSQSFTVGQVFYQQNSGFTATENQGVQQPYEITVVTRTEGSDLSLLVDVLPNPTTDHLVVRVAGPIQQDLHYQLTDVQGKQIAQRAVRSDLTEIPMGHLAPGTYLLSIYSDQGSVITHKIIKQ